MLPTVADEMLQFDHRGLSDMVATGGGWAYGPVQMAYKWHKWHINMVYKWYIDGIKLKSLFSKLLRVFSDVWPAQTALKYPKYNGENWLNRAVIWCGHLGSISSPFRGSDSPVAWCNSLRGGNIRLIDWFDGKFSSNITEDVRLWFLPPLMRTTNYTQKGIRSMPRVKRSCPIDRGA